MRATTNSSHWASRAAAVLLVVCIIVLLARTDPPFRNTVVCENETLVALFGDILIGGGRVWRQVRSNELNGAILGEAAPVLHESDIVFANFEGALVEDTDARDKGLPESFSVGTPPGILDLFDMVPALVLSFANNHSADFGTAGLHASERAVAAHEQVVSVGIGTDREDARMPVILGTEPRIAFVALTDLLPEGQYATTGSGVAELTHENLEAAVRDAASRADIVIVSLHTADDVATTYTYTPDAHQVEFARAAVDAGADVVVGHHPHGLQRFEIYNGGLIFHSLGLFLYNPAVSDRYPRTHPLHGPTQLHGGGMAVLTYCGETLHDVAVTPIEIQETDGLLTIERAFSFRALRDELRANFLIQ